MSSTEMPGLGLAGLTLVIPGLDSRPNGAGMINGFDPIGFNGGDANLYRYVGNDPVNEVDPSGLIGEDLVSDWAGRAILWRYLTAGGDWTITNNPEWSGYLLTNEKLRIQLQNQIRQHARTVLLAKPTNGQCGEVDISFHAEIENGEGNVGYEYLHGTNYDVGDFMIYGKWKAIVDPKTGLTSIQYNVRYQWNDIIDPNPQYASDTWKARIAHIITLGNAESYILRIAWDSQTNYTASLSDSPYGPQINEDPKQTDGASFTKCPPSNTRRR